MGRPPTTLAEKQRKKKARNERYRVKLKSLQQGSPKSSTPETSITDQPSYSGLDQGLTNSSRSHVKIQPRDEIVVQDTTTKYIVNQAYSTIAGDLARASTLVVTVTVSSQVRPFVLQTDLQTGQTGSCP